MLPKYFWLFIYKNDEIHCLFISNDKKISLKIGEYLLYSIGKQVLTWVGYLKWQLFPQ